MVDVTGVGLALIGAISLAVMSLCVRLGGTNQGKTATAVVVSLLVNVVVVVPTVGVLFYPEYGVTPTSALAFVGAGLFGTMLGRAFYYEGIDRIGSSRADPIKASMPMFATIFAVALLGETLTLLHFMGIVLIVGGVAAISWETSRDQSGPAGRVLAIDIAIPVAAAFFFGVEPTLVKFGINEGTPVTVGLAIKIVAATIGMVAYLGWQGALPDRSDLTGHGMRWYLAAGVANTSFLAAYYVALGIVPVVVAAPIIQLSPLFVILGSFVFLQRIERVTWRLTTAASVVVAGATLVATYS